MLGVLSDDELARYGEIARDQAEQELNRWWWQALLALGAVGALTWAAHKMMAAPTGATSWRPLIVAFGVSLALGYWPYRRIKNWALWKGHVKAVGAEQNRRRNWQG